MHRFHSLLSLVNRQVLMCETNLGIVARDEYRRTYRKAI